MKAYKGFKKDLTCLGYKFNEDGINKTDQANCRENGFHCAENPMDCLDYYFDWKNSVYYEVDAAGDIDEDEIDSKISCTEMQLVKRLTIEQLLFEGLIYMVEHPERNWNGHVKKECGKAYNGFVVVRGKNPIASGNLGDILVLLKEEENCSAIEEVAFLKIDGSRCYPKIDYTVKGIANDQEEVCA